MNDPTIVCPQCKVEIKLTETLAAPIIESTRQKFEAEAQKRDAQLRQREAALAEELKRLDAAKASLDEQLQQRLAQERAAIAAAESKKAREALSLEIDRSKQELAERDRLLTERDAKLKAAQQAELDLRRKQLELEEKSREVDLTVARRVAEESDRVRQAAVKQATDEYQLKVAEKEKVIADMQRQVEELKRKADQGSQQLQGEVQELELESLLRERFPRDVIEPVPKGQFGGDVLQRVCSASGLACGTILWESKRTKNWSDTWLPKLRDDQRAAKAEVAALLTTVLPKGINSFDQIDGVWVTDARCVMPVAVVLRHALIEVAGARQASDGQQTKMALVYDYLLSPAFRHRVQAIVEAFSIMQEDLDKERKAISKQWEKRQKQINRVLDATSGLWGDLQGIAGKSLAELEGLDLDRLSDESPAAITDRSSQ
jgi:hypothetical protein